MASVAVARLNRSEVAKLACKYASLIFYDDEQNITMNVLLKIL
jgi:hypothetical protein